LALQLSGITWILSYRCNLDCRHCFFDVSGELRVLDPELAAQALASIDQPGPLAWQHVSGGEPLLFEQELYRLLEVIRQHGSQTIGIASNGFWGDSVQRARQTVLQLKQHGVNGICLSADGYHQQRLPREFVRTAAEQVAKQGLNRHSFVVCCDTDDALAPIEDSDFALPLARVPVRSIGRGATASLIDSAEGIPEAPCRNLCCCLGETTPFDPQMVWIDPYGNVMICYGLIIGSLQERSLGAILNQYSVSQSPLLQILAEQGPIGLYRLAVSKGWQPRSQFADECALCWQARRFLRREWPAILGPDECYPAAGEPESDV
jgi:Radical SAM superfamily